MSKAAAAGVSNGAFFELRAQLEQKKAEGAISRKARLAKGLQEPDLKKGTKWERPNKGVKDRAARDSTEWALVNNDDYEVMQAKLKAKAKTYSRLEKGQSGSMTEKQYDSLLVNFDDKEPVNDSSDSEEEEGSPDGDDPEVEYIDDLGRTRTVRKSQVPREFLNSTITGNEPARNDEDAYDDDPYVLSGPIASTNLQVYEHTEEELESIRQAALEESNPLNVHYDGTNENRYRGAASYQFSKDEELRKRQLDELKGAREETKKGRAETGAVDILPGQEIGNIDAGTESGPSRAMAKRKHDIEERRKQLAIKRQKRSEAMPSDTKEAISSNPPPVAESPKIALNADDFLANIEQSMMKQR